MKWIGHETAGLTPGQQLARLVMVTPADIRQAKVWASEKGLDPKGFDKVVLAMSWKAERLAKLNGWDSRDAWSVLMAAQKELMPYVHQKQGSIEPEAVDKRAVIYADATPLGSVANPSQDIDNQVEISFEPLGLTQQGSHKASEA